MRVSRAGLAQGCARVAVALCVGSGFACKPPDSVLRIHAEPPTCAREPVSALKMTLLGDFPPVPITEGVNVEGLRQDLAGARSLTLEGIAPRGVVAHGWTGPLPTLVPGEIRDVPVLYGAPESLCQVKALRLPRAFHHSVDLGDGQLLVTGGLAAEGPTDTLERYSAATAEIFATQPLYEGAAIGHSATLLRDGTVLVAGGARPDETRQDRARERARVYKKDGDPAGGVLLLEGGPRALHAAVRLPDGQVWLSGGCRILEPLFAGVPTCPASEVLDTSVRYEEGGTFTAGPLLSVPRYGHKATLLPDGRVLVSGGMTVDPMLGVIPANRVEVIDPKRPPGAVGTVSEGPGAGATALLPTGGLLYTDASVAEGGGLVFPWVPQSMGAGNVEVGPAIAPRAPRRYAELSPLLDGGALLSGGIDNGGSLVGALELYEGGSFRLLSPMLPRVGHVALPLADGSVILFGGLSPGTSPEPRPSSQVLRYVPSLRVPDATPPGWPLARPDGPKWLTPRRPDRATFDGTTLVIQEPQGRKDRPTEFALISGVTWAGGTLGVTVRIEGGAALVLGYQDPGEFTYLRLVPSESVALYKATQTKPLDGCAGLTFDLPENQPVSLRLRYSGGTFAVSLLSRDVLTCSATLPRGGLGFASLSGRAEFQDFSLVRGR